MTMVMEKKHILNSEERSEEKRRKRERNDKRS